MRTLPLVLLLLLPMADTRRAADEAAPATPASKPAADPPAAKAPAEPPAAETPKPVWNPDISQPIDFHAGWTPVPITSHTKTPSNSSGRRSFAT